MAQHAHTDYHELLARNDIDAVSVCVPSGLHAQVAIDAMQAGKHVLVEKPIAITLADADRMIEVSQSSGRTMGVVLQNRYNHPMQTLRKPLTRANSVASIWAMPVCAGTDRNPIMKMAGMARGRWMAAR